MGGRKLLEFTFSAGGITILFKYTIHTSEYIAFPLGTRLTNMMLSVF